MQALADVLKQLWSGENQIVSSNELKKVVGWQKPEFAAFGQEDAHEFLTMLIEWLNSDITTNVVSCFSFITQKKSLSL